MLLRPLGIQLGHSSKGPTIIMKQLVLLLITTNNNLFMLKYYDIDIIVLIFLN